MSIRCWRRLAGSIAISCGLASGASDYRVGTAEAGRVKAVVLEDRQGNRAIIADAGFTITLTTGDYIAAQLLKSYPLNRSGLLLHSVASGAPAPAEAVTAIAAALGNLEPARVLFDGSLFSIVSEEKQCRAVFFPVAFAGCSAGPPVRGPVRSAFQVVEPAHGLEHRDETPPAFPVQAIAFGKQAAILALGGEPPATGLSLRGLIVIPQCNGDGHLTPDAIVNAAIQQVLRRVGR